MTDEKLRQAINKGLVEAVEELSRPTSIRRVIEATGTYSISICHPGANLAPPQYLLDAWRAAEAEILLLRSQLPKSDVRERVATEHDRQGPVALEALQHRHAAVDNPDDHNQPPTHRGSPVQPHEQRVMDEKAQLDEKRAKLADFLDGEAVKQLSPDERERLHRQAGIMAAYSQVLNERIVAFLPDGTVGDRTLEGNETRHT